MGNGRPLKTSISQASIDEVVAFVCRHIEPDGKPSQMASTGYDWFYDHFSFIAENDIRSQLAQAYYQSRYVHKLLVALRLDGKESQPFLLLQLFEYASIYEALTDFLIGKKYLNSPDFKFYKTVKEIKKFPQLNAKGSRLIHDSGTPQEVFFAYEKEKELQLRDIRFSDRIAYLAKKLNLSQSDALYIAKIYDLRNHIHLLKAASDNFVPDHRDGAKAFRILKRFVEAVKDDLAKP